MSKKLIAVASAAALALAGLVAAPANAASISSVFIYHATETSGATVVAHADADSAIAATTWASARNVVFGGTGAASYNATRTAVRFEVITTGATPVTVTSTGGVKMATAVSVAGVALKVDAGSQTLTGTTTAGSAATLTYIFYAWNTSTTAGSVVIETTNSKATYYVKGTLGPAYSITNVTMPASLYTGQADGKVTFNLVDAYGNSTAAAGPALTPSGFGFTGGNIATWSTVTKLWSSTLPTITGANVAIGLALTAFDANDYTLNGFTAPVRSAFASIGAGNLTTQNAALVTEVATLKASVAALQASMADMRTKALSVTKKKYNSLARKYNAQNPSARVALKK